jgi:hypothetical protein
MRVYEICFKLFNWVFLFTFDMYPSYPHPERKSYGSSSNFGKWKTNPYGLPVNKYKPKKKRK